MSAQSRCARAQRCLARLTLTQKLRLQIQQVSVFSDEVKSEYGIVEAVFSKEIQAGLDQARMQALKKSSRLRVSYGEEVLPVLRMWKTGFAMEADQPALRGFVELYDGSIHLFQCLIVASDEEGGERRYEFKRATAIVEKPAVDFEVPDNAPAGLIEKTR